jgi:uncharacterized repeat protein (TIGR01451 family)
MDPPADHARAALHVPANQKSTSKPSPAVRATKLATGASAFIENRGQFDARAKFQWKGSGRTLWLTEQGIVFDAIRPKAEETSIAPYQPWKPAFQSSSPSRASREYDRLVFVEEFLGTHHTPTIEASQPLPGRYNYFLGNDPTQWHTNVQGYAEVVYRDVWDGIDLRFSRNGPDLEQEFIVRPGGDLTKVQVAFKGIDGLHVADDGSLMVRTAFGEFRESPPRIYQEIAGQRVPVEGRFKLTSQTTYTFEVNGYQPQYALVIDPTLLYSTFLGGSIGAECTSLGCSIHEYAASIAVDSSGSAYVTGPTGASDFPVTPGAFQTTFPGYPGSSIFVTKLSPLGDALVYSTFLGPSTGGAIDFGPFTGGGGRSAIALDSSGNAYVTAIAFVNFPTTPNAFQPTCYSGNSGSTNSIFLAKLSATGNALIYSTCIGGGTQFGIGDVSPTGLAVDRSGRAYIVGSTHGGLLVTAGAFQTTPSSNVGCCSYVPDAFLSVLDPSVSGPSSLVYSTYLKGSASDVATGVATDSFGMAYVTGQTSSTDFPVTPGALQTAFPAQAQAGISFVTKFDPTQSGPASLMYSTYLGVGSNGNSLAGFNGDNAEAIAGDVLGNTYIAGITTSGKGTLPFPTTPGAIQPNYGGGDSNGFVATLNAAGNKLIYSTYIGGFQSGAHGVAVDATGDVYVTGFTSGSYYPTADAAQPYFGGCGHSFGGACDGFIAKLNPTGDTLLYGSYLGGFDGDLPLAIAVDPAGDAYVTGYTASPSFPVTSGAFQPKLNPVGFPGCCDGGPVDAFVTKFLLGSPAGFSVTGILPHTGGNAGRVTPTIVGSGFHNGLTLKLAGGGQPDIVATDVHVDTLGRIATATFDLQGAGAVPSLYDLVATNPGGSSVTLSAAFTVEQGGAPDIRVNKISTAAVSGHNMTYVITVSNQGNVDAHDFVVSEYLEPWFTYVSASPAPDNIIQSEDFFPVGAVGTGYAAFLDWKMPLLDLGPTVRAFLYTVELDGAFPGHETVIGRVCIESASRVCESEFQQCLAQRLPPCQNLYSISQAAVVQCIRSGTQFCQQIRDNCYLGAMTGALFGAGRCAADTKQALSAGDPNDLVGPTGAGTLQWMAAGVPFQYLIAFGNEENATAPAQQVVVTNPIDPNADLSTLQLTGINLVGIQLPLSTTFQPAVGLNEFVTNVDLRPAQNLFIHVNVKLDPTSRVLTWTFTSIDPATGQLPTDPLVGFLPPGAVGNVSFLVSPNKGLSTGTPITDQASIVFDTLAPTATAPWTNTIDASSPTSHVASLPTTVAPGNFTVHWSGTDVGVGIQDYTIFVSDNGSPFTPWQTNMTATSATYLGVVGHTYGFFSQARDLVGNVEALKTQAEATTRVVSALPGDLNGDGKVDCQDLAIVKTSFGKQCGQPGFDPRADTNNDCVVNVKDLAFVAQHLPAGTHCP